MGRVFLSFLTDDDQEIPDLMGRDAQSFSDVVELAMAEARELAALDIRDGALNLSHGIRVVDVNGHEITTVRIRDVITITQQGRAPAEA